MTRLPPEWDWTNVRALCLRETRRVLGASSAADDAAQEAAIRAWHHRGRCRTPARPDPWIATIARREAFRTLSERSEQSLDEAPRRPIRANYRPNRSKPWTFGGRFGPWTDPTGGCWSVTTGKISPTASSPSSWGSPNRR